MNPLRQERGEQRMGRYSREHPLPFGGVCPPRLLGFARHEAYSGNEDVDKTRIAMLTCDGFELHDHGVWVAANDFRWRSDTNPSQLLSDRWSNVR